MSRWLFRSALRLVPASWREAVRFDFEQEAGASSRGRSCSAVEVAAIGLRLHLLSWRDQMGSDILYAVRSLLRSRWFAGGAVLTFALGMGVNVAVFSVADHFILRPLPYAKPGELVLIIRSTADALSFSLPKVIAVGARRQTDLFADVAFAGTTDPYPLSDAAAGVDALQLTDVSYNALEVLGVRPVRGRGFTREDALASAHLVVLSHEAWMQRFGGAAEIIGRRFGAGAQSKEIVGVLPRGFVPPTVMWGDRSDGLLLSTEILDTAREKEAVPASFARLQPGVSVATAQAAVTAITAQIAPAGGAPSRASATRTLVTPLQRGMFNGYSRYLWLVFAAASMVLLVACANLSSLLLVRGRMREQDLAIRASLGASPSRLVTSALVESIVIAVAGSAVAWVMLTWTGHALLAIVPSQVRQYAATTLDGRVLAMTLSAAIICAVLAGALPAIRAVRVDVLSTLKRGSRIGRRRRAVGASSLLVVEAAFGVVLVAGAVLTARSLVGLLRTDLGFVPQDLYMVAANLPGRPAPLERLAVQNRALELAALQSGVRSVGGIDSFSIGGNTAPRGFPSVPEVPGGGLWQVAGGLFETLGTPILAGRTISEDDRRFRAAVAVISEAGMRALWPEARPADALGRIITVKDEPDRQVIGVVGNFRRQQMGAPVPAVYVPLGSASDPRSARMMLVVRMQPGARFDAAALRDRLRQEFDGVTVSVSDVDSQLAPWMRQPQFQAALFGSFAGVALVLAAIGLYAVASFDVALRRYELGVRLALGATARDVRHLVVVEALRPVAVGLGIGLLGAYWSAQFLQAFLHQVDAHDPLSLLFVSVVLILATIAAAWLPACRAGRTDPAVVLRAQ